MTDRPCSPTASLPPDRRGRLRNGATPGDFLGAIGVGDDLLQCIGDAGTCMRQPAGR